MTNRALLTIATLSAALTLAACGDDSTKPAPAPTGATPTSATPAVADLQAQAQKLIDEVTQNIKDNKLDAADKALTQLETLKPKMTPEWQARVDQARSALDTAKKAANLKLPG